MSTEPNYDAMLEERDWPLLDGSLLPEIVMLLPDLFPAYESLSNGKIGWAQFEEAAIKAGYQWWIDGLWKRSDEIKQRRLNTPPPVVDNGDDKAF